MAHADFRERRKGQAAANATASWLTQILNSPEVRPDHTQEGHPSIQDLRTNAPAAVCPRHCDMIHCIYRCLQHARSVSQSFTAR